MATWYRTGTVAVTNGNATIVGTGTLWTLNSNAGDIFIGPDLAQYEISAVTDDTHINVKTLAGVAGYAGSTLSNQNYAIIRNFTSTLSSQLAAQLTTLVDNWQTREDQFRAWQAGTANGGPNNDGAYPLTDAVGVTNNVYCPAKLEAVAGGVTKIPVKCATTATITLSGTQTIDTIAANAGDRVLVKDQSTGSQNGIYVVASGAWARAADFDVSADAVSGCIIPVQQGGANGLSIWHLTNTGTINLGTTALTFAQIYPSSGSTTTMGSLIASATDKATPIDADYVGLMDSAASNVLKKLSWANIKATLKTYFDTLYVYTLATFMGYTTTATVAGTTTLTVSSTYHQYFTGTTTQTIVMPVVTALTAGWSVRIVNNSTGSLTVNSSGGNAIVTIPPGTSAILTCILVTGTTAASWGATTICTTSGNGLVAFAVGTLVAGGSITGSYKIVSDGWIGGTRLTSTGPIVAETSIILGNSSGGLLYLDGGFNASISSTINGSGGGAIRCIAGSLGVQLASGGTSWSSLSDERAKDIIVNIENAASKVQSLRAVIGKYKEDETEKHRSFLIAQDVQAVLPEAISELPDGMLGLSYTDVIPLLVAAINEHSATITALEQRLTALESK